MNYIKVPTTKWLKFIKDTLISVGKADLFNQININNPKGTKHFITQTLKDTNKQTKQNKQTEFIQHKAKYMLLAYIKHCSVKNMKR